MLAELIDIGGGNPDGQNTTTLINAGYAIAMGRS